MADTKQEFSQEGPARSSKNTEVENGRLGSGGAATQISVHLKDDVVDGMRQGRSTGPGLQELMTTASHLGLDLRPMHPGTVDPQLRSLYTVDVADPAKTEEVIKKLRACNAVDSAYHKPAAELP